MQTPHGRPGLLGTRRLPAAMRWGALFDRAAAYSVTENQVREALARRRRGESS